MAWLAVSFCRYLGYFMHLPDWGANVVGCALVIVLTWINYRGVVLGAWVQKIFTGAKLTGIFVLIVVFMPEGLVPGCARLWRWAIAARGSRAPRAALRREGGR